MKVCKHFLACHYLIEEMKSVRQIFPLFILVLMPSTYFIIILSLE